MTESEAKEILKDTTWHYRNKKEAPIAMDIAIKALEKQEKIKETFEKWKNDTSGIYGADEETTRLVNELLRILRSEEE